MADSRSLLLPLVLVTAGSALRAQCELETQEFSAPDGASGDVFGYRIARSGNIAVVAATFDDAPGVDSGSAYVYERDPLAGWVLVKKLVPEVPLAGIIFAYSVAVDGTRILVGAPLRPDTLPAQGAVYVFERDQGGPGNWGEVAHFTPANAPAGAFFGFSLAVQGDELLVGAPNPGAPTPGSAYLYRRDAASPSGWTLAREFQAADPATGFAFGHAVALDGDVLAVSGGLRPEVPYASTYVVHVRERNAGGAEAWNEVAALATSSDARDIFGYRLALDDGWLAVVAPGEVELDTGRIGAAYVYRRDEGGASAWGLVRRLTSDSGAQFVPEQVTLDGDWLALGAPSVDGAGAVFLFGRDVGGANRWGEVTKLQDLPLEPEFAFGQGLALAGGELLVGASGMYASGPSGEVYAYDLGRLARASWRNDAAHRNPDSLTVSAPELGTLLAAVVDLAPSGHDFAALMVFQRRAEIAFPTGQVLLGRERIGLTLASGPRAAFSLALPSAPALCGLEVTLQAAHLARGRPFQLSNAQDLVLGTR